MRGACEGPAATPTTGAACLLAPTHVPLPWCCLLLGLQVPTHVWSTATHSYIILSLLS